ncbi:MBL fold metallo-hydrolase [Anaerolinea sp.]|uniref:MBL fold metallo-hydrolase n=1 Tax=Anaerolinea sp. TaxID=1872519 RepID=UPI002ACE09C2|nr:MBL fold metallo-hydrolase [Anaerolinea sp.]
MATHYHMDHAGLAEELKREGVSLLVMDMQVPAIPVMKTWMKSHDHYVDITPHGNVVISTAQSRALLAEIGTAGEILYTPEHTDHCVSLFLDDGSVFTDDLLLEPYAFDNPTALAAWKMLRERGARCIYPAVFSLHPFFPKSAPQFCYSLSRYLI